ncbi:MAG TPA: hypothetical protein VMC83_24830 [Streptosporangiaceae bacterium]|nr:hypothetical protein [Streptosporangiaceae bacterium]
MTPAVKLVGFIVLLIAVFAAAHAAGAALGPLTTGHSPVTSVGGTGGGMSGMNMGGNP